MSDIFYSTPRVNEGRVAYHVQQRLADGKTPYEFRFDGLYGDVRDEAVVARICGLRALVKAAKSAADTIEKIQKTFQETGSGNAVLWRLKTTYRKTAEILDTNWHVFDEALDEEERQQSFHELDAQAVSLIEAAAVSARQIEYLAEKFGATDWEGAVAAVDAAVGRSESAELRFQDDEHRADYEAWRTRSAAELAENRARFRR